MKKLVLFGIIILMVIPGAFAQFRMDLAIDIPVILVHCKTLTFA